MVLIIDKAIGMGFLKMEWTDEKCNLLSKWREFDTQREKGILTFLRNGGWWDVVFKVLCEGAPLPCINWGQGKGWSLSSGGKTEVFQPIALYYRPSELSVGNGIQSRIPATANKWPSDGGATQTCSNQPKMFLVRKYWWPLHLLLLSSTFVWEESSSK